MIGTAPRSPAQPISVCSRRLNRERNSERYTLSGRATSVRNAVTSDGDAEHRQDPAGEHEQAERQEHGDLHEPGEAVVEARQAALVDVGAVRPARGRRRTRRGTRCRPAYAVAPNVSSTRVRLSTG